MLVNMLTSLITIVRCRSITPRNSHLLGKAYEVLHSLLVSKLAGTGVSPFITRYGHGGLLGIYASAASSETPALLGSAVAALKSIAGGSSSVDTAKNQVVSDYARVSCNWSHW